jgi:regulator of protease activity HflC (stomatin/prohibitin superfamily)
MRYRMSASSPENRPDDYGVRPADLVKFGLAALGVIILAIVGFVWFVCRIEVPDGHFVPVMRKTGENMSNDMVLATGDIKGPQFEILKEGRHFRNPYNWWWPRKTEKATVIPKLSVGVVTRRFGEVLPEGEIIAREEDRKGILEKTLRPGRHYLSPWAFDVDEVPMVNIPAGFMGVVTLKVGPEPENPNVFVVGEGERGTQPNLLPPGIHEEYSNPYMYKVTPIEVRSQKFEMGEEYAVTFPSKYGFDIRVEGTIEWRPDLTKLPELFVKYVDREDLDRSGGIDNLQRKIILPFARSFFRTIGGQYRAVDYITGDTRIRVQNEVERRLKDACAKEGIVIRSFVIRSTEPPEAIREQYQRREIARREMDRFDKEILTEIGGAVLDGATPKLDAAGNQILDERGAVVMEGGTPRLDDQGRAVREGGRLAKIIEERKKDRQRQLGEIRVQIVVAVREAEQYKAVEVTKAQRDLEVARIALEAAKDRAARILAEGTAEAQVTVMKNKAEAEAVRAKVMAFGEGSKYAEYQLITKLSPGIRSVLSNTEGLFAKLFERFSAMGGSE